MTREDFPGASLDAVKAGGADLVPDDPETWWEQSYVKARQDWCEAERLKLRAAGWDEENACREAKRRWRITK